MSKTYINIEQLDNGWLVAATDVSDDGKADNVRYAVHSVEELLQTLALGLTPAPQNYDASDIDIETDEEVQWPDDTPPETIN